MMATSLIAEFSIHENYTAQKQCVDFLFAGIPT